MPSHKKPKARPRTRADAVELLERHLLNQQDMQRRINSMMIDLLARLRDVERIADSQPNIRRMTACHMLAGMLASPNVVDRTAVNKQQWAKIALEFADALIDVDREDRRVSDIYRRTRSRCEDIAT